MQHITRSASFRIALSQNSTGRRPLLHGHVCGFSDHCRTRLFFRMSAFVDVF